MGEQNLFRRGAIWWLRTTVKGVEVRESLRTRDLKIARRVRDRRLDEIAGEAHRGEKVIGWGDAVEAWASHVAGQIAASTAKRYAVSLLQCRSTLEPKRISEIDGKVIAALIAARRAAGATPATIRRDLTAISQVLEFAEGEGWREGNPTLSKRRILKERRDPIQLPDHDEISLVIAAASARFGALITAAWLTGCRQAELVDARRRGFDPKRQTLTITGKGNKRRTITLSDEAAAHISAQPTTLGSDLIFCREGGVAFAEAASDFTHLRRSVAAKAEREGRPFRGFRFHDLRHLFAVEALKSGMDIYTLSKHLGHTSVKTTEIYLEFLSPEEAEAARHGSAQTSAQHKRSREAATG